MRSQLYKIFSLTWEPIDPEPSIKNIKSVFCFGQLVSTVQTLPGGKCADIETSI